MAEDRAHAFLGFALLLSFILDFVTFAVAFLLRAAVLTGPPDPDALLLLQGLIGIIGAVTLWLIGQKRSKRT